MNDFDGQTWAAFSDLCGLKTLYEKDANQAAQALDRFYNTVYKLQHRGNSINSIVVSDCAVFWIDRIECISDIGILLDHLKMLHRQMLPDYLICSTVAYGHFKYQGRLEMPRIRKNMIVGSAYLDAYANNDKIDHGAIVIIKLPEDTNYSNLRLGKEYTDMIKTNCPQKGFYEYLWPLRNKSQISSFIDQRKEIHNAVFREMKNLYSQYQDHNRERREMDT